MITNCYNQTTIAERIKNNNTHLHAISSTYSREI